jgi:hypothetical protein
MGFFKRYALLLAVTTALPVSAAHAYLDPASVSIAFQAMVGAIAAYILTGKYYLQKIKSVFVRDKKSEDTVSESAE